MKQRVLIFLLCISSGLLAREKLDEEYQVSFGKERSPHQVTEYFSFSCPHCTNAFRQEFSKIEKKYIETSLLSWKFHPVPMDVLTIQAMVCMEKLNPKQKQIFLRTLLSLPSGTPSETTTNIMKEGMIAAGHPLPRLGEIEFLKTTKAFQAAFLFVSQREAINEVPSLEWDGVFYEGLPDLQTIEKIHSLHFTPCNQVGIQ